MRNNKLGYNETTERFGIRYKRIQDWEHIYLEEGVDGLYIERRGRASSIDGVKKGLPQKFDKKVEEDLIAEVQRMRAENDYLKN